MSLKNEGSAALYILITYPLTRKTPNLFVGKKKTKVKMRGSFYNGTI